jgi:AcrR family transcriptional regulator
MARRSEHSLEEIKTMVLDAAEAIVISEGFAALKVRKVALEIGYTVGSIYMVFTNMGDLIMHVKARTLDGLADQLGEHLPECAPQEKILKLAKSYLQFANENYNLWSMIFEHRLPDHEKTPDWYQAKIDQAFVKVEKLLGQLAPEPDQSDIQSAARALWSGVHGICVLSLTGTLDAVGVKKVENNIVLLVENFIRGWASVPKSSV